MVAIVGATDHFKVHAESIIAELIKLIAEEFGAAANCGHVLYVDNTIRCGEIIRSNTVQGGGFSDGGTVTLNVRAHALVY